jgi:hypothetical protein
MIAMDYFIKWVDIYDVHKQETSAIVETLATNFDELLLQLQSNNYSTTKARTSRLALYMKCCNGWG